VAQKTSLALVSVLLISAFSGCYDVWIEYDIDDANQFWNQYDEHYYVKRTQPNNNSIEIADKLINNNEIFLHRYWEPFVFDEDELDWSENPYDDHTWQFYYHSLRMVSFLINAYELRGDIAYLEKAQWFIDSWMEHNPNRWHQASHKAWADHSTANRITTFIYFWDHYRNSETFDNEFANKFLNVLRMHGEYTAKNWYYTWESNHGIFQDRALMQLAVLFPNFERSGEWLETSISRLSFHLETDVTPSGVHKEHSTGYHYIVLILFMSISEFNLHYNISNDKLDSMIYKMQEYLVRIAKPDGTIPVVGDSAPYYVLGISESQITNEHLLYLVSNGNKGEKIVEDSAVYQDAGVAILKNNWDTAPPLYFALFNAFHSGAHKQSDDLSFVLTYQQTDYFVDSGKYNDDLKDPYRKFMRSVFAHNSITVDDRSYSASYPDNFGKSVIEHFVIASNYSYVKASHTLYEGVKITRSVVFFNDGAVYFHDEIESDVPHKYTQIFNVGKDVNVDDTDENNIFLSSTKDNSSLTLKQLNAIAKFEIYHGSDDPIRGWQSTTFNEVFPITTLNFQRTGKDVVFETAININLNITEVDKFQDGDKEVYVFTFDNNRTERIEID
jgi:hypothetical protein